MKSTISKSSLERLLKLDDQERNRLERKGAEMGKTNSPSSSSKSMSKFELEEKNKLIKAYSKFSTDAKTSIKTWKEKSEVLRKLDFQLPKSLDETDQLHENEREQIQKLVGESSSKYEEVRVKAEDLTERCKQLKFRWIKDH